ncbi:MAG TPA: hypothetical protein H9752_10525 [Candidatus Phocaeicola excrementigallinarum]|nr:hypothetical protein [Candidatus Phocaeicola excrementigallinarum]
MTGYEKKSHPAQKILTAITMEKHLPLKVAKSKVTFTGEQKAMPDKELAIIGRKDTSHKCVRIKILPILKRGRLKR